MMMELFRPLSSRCAIVLISALILLPPASGCFDDAYEGGLSSNRPPSVKLVSGPPEGSETNYRIHFYWHGFDPDGDIRYFEYAIADNVNGAFNPADTTGRSKWTRTADYDREFLFSADEIADTSSNDMITQFERSHTFFIRAVDNLGLASPRPAYRSFTATTLSPTVDISLPAYPGLGPARVPAIANFHWTATDYIDNTQNTQAPDSVRWILLDCSDFDDDPAATLDYIRTHPDSPEWSGWHPYLGPNGQSWTTPPLGYGSGMFAVQAKDEAGAVTPVFDRSRNVRWFYVASDGWPLLVLRNEYFPTMATTIAGTNCWIANVPAGLEMMFEWWGDADSYGGIIDAYRYGWDISDLNVDEQWAIDWTPFNGSWAASPSRTYYYGAHTFHVEIKDNSGFKARICVKMNFIPFQMVKPLAVVDDFAEDISWSQLVTDEEHDNFWRDMAGNVDGFNPVADMVEVSRDLPLSIDQLAQYKNIIWNVRGGHQLLPSQQPLLHDLLEYFPEEGLWFFGPVLQTNLLAMYLAIGGHILICGEEPMTTALNPDFLGPNKKFPVILKYELGGDQNGDYGDQINDPVGDQSFPYRDMCLDVLDLAYPCPNCLRTSANGCDVTGLRGTRPKEDGLRECIPIDPGFPPLTLKPEFTSPGAVLDPDIRGLQAELYNPAYFSCGYLDLGPRLCFEPIYGLGCQDLTSNLYSSPIAAWTRVYENVIPDAPGGVAARSALWGFEPFFFDTTAVRSALEVILFDEWQLNRK